MSNRPTITTRQVGRYTVVGSTALAGREFALVHDFLAANARHFDKLQEMGRVYFAITADRVAAFKAYADRNGFNVA